MSKVIGSIVGGIVLLVALFTLGFTNVAPTEVAVEINKVLGKVNPDPKGVGYHFYNRWVTDLVKYNVAARSYPGNTKENENSKEYTLSFKTNDGQNARVDLTVIYSLNGKDVPALHSSIGKNYEDQILLPSIRSVARLVLGSYPAEDLYQGAVRSDIQANMASELKQSVIKYPAINIQDALIRDFDFNDEFERAIEQKKLASQLVEINKNKALAQEEESKRQEAEARGLKLQAIQDAEGKAQSVKLAADAEKYKLEQEAAGNLAKYKAEAEGTRLKAEALGGGSNVVALEWAKNIPDKLQIWGIPTGQSSTSLMDLNGVFGNMLKTRDN